MPKNLIVIVTDTLRHPDFLPGFAQGTAMPFLARVVPNAVVFDGAVASSCWTPPSHVSLLSGADPWETLFHPASRSSRVPDVPFIGDLWQRNGGESVAFSANWLVDPEVGTCRGYERFNAGMSTSLSGLALRGIQVAGFEQLLHAELGVLADERNGIGPHRLASVLQYAGTGFHLALRSVYSGARLEWAVGRYLKRRSDPRPLHLFLNLMETHEPYVRPGTVGPRGLNPTWLPTVNLARHTMILSRWPADIGMMQSYLSAVRELDARLEGIFGLLQHHGLLDDAALLILSDHGQGLGEHGFFGHAFFLYDELVRVPAFYLEFHDGRPSLPPARLRDWVDLRHLFDLMSRRALGGVDDPPARILAESVAQRGPATAYWEGPRPNPPRGFFRSLPVSTYHRTARVFGSDSSWAIDDQGQSVPLGIDPGRWDETLIAYAEKAVRKGTTFDAFPRSLGRKDAEVDRRLKSWGYD